MKFATTMLLLILIFNNAHPIEIHKNDFVSVNFANKKFKLKIKTKNNSIIGLQIEAKNCDDAKVKVNRRYPGCEFLSCQEK